MWPLRFLLLAIAAASFASADNFVVTSTNCLGPGSIMDAVNRANTIPGSHNIFFQPGIEIDISDGSCQTQQTRDVRDYYTFKVNKSITFHGNGALLQGAIYWVDVNGQMSMEQCPSRNPRTKMLVSTAGFLQVGQPDTDNSGINVVVRSLRLQEVSAVVDVGENATVELFDVSASKVYDFFRTCQRPPVLAHEGSGLKVTGCYFKDARTWASGSFDFGSGMIYADRTSYLYVDRTKISLCQCEYAIRWNAAASRIANIVSCNIEASNGIAIFGIDPARATANIVNTAILMEGATTSDLEFKRILVAGPVTVKLQASTVVTGVVVCSMQPCTLVNAPLNVLNSGELMLEQTAVNVVYPNVGQQEILLALDGGTCKADIYTWMQPVASQNSTVLKTLCNQPGLLTDPPALIQNCVDCAGVDYITPLVPGVLINVVPPSVLLQDPQTGVNITKDVLGNPRYHSTLMRDIGAVQQWLAPTIQVISVNDSRVRLSWNTADYPFNASYQLYYKPAGTATWFESGTTSNLRTREVEGLTNGVMYEFKVNGVNATLNPGPDSNIVTATPGGPFPAPSGFTLSPPPGPSAINLCWTPPSTGGRTIQGYFVFYQAIDSDCLQSLPLTTDTCATISGLTPSAAYKVCVNAVSTNSEMSETGCVSPPIMTASCSVSSWSRRARRSYLDMYLSDTLLMFVTLPSLLFCLSQL